MEYRCLLKRKDINSIERIVRESSFFNTEEISVAKELAFESYKKGSKKSGYNFIIAENNGEIMGFSCYGKIPCTKTSYDLYWIVIDKNFKNSGTGSSLLKETELAIKKESGERVYAETSSVELYTPTRKFYEKNNYLNVSEIKDFYDTGDNRIIYEKVL